MPDNDSTLTATPPPTDAATAPPAGDSAATTPEATASPATDPVAIEAKRREDAQRWGHEKAQEAAALRQQNAELQAQLSRTFNDPTLAPVPPTAAPGTPTTDEDAEYEQAYNDYKNAPDDKQAITRLMKASKAIAKKEITRDLEQREVQQSNLARHQARQARINEAVSETVATQAPDVPLKLFWANAKQAQAETPADITNIVDRINWQTNRAIQLARADMAPVVTKARDAGSEAVALRSSANAVMAGGSHARPGAAPAEAPKAEPNMVEQIRAMQRPMLSRVR